MPRREMFDAGTPFLPGFAPNPTFTFQKNAERPSHAGQPVPAYGPSAPQTPDFFAFLSRRG